MIDTVIFDMDGVLIDSEPIHQRVNLAYFDKLGASVAQDFYDQNFIGLPLEQMLIYLKKEHHLQQGIAEMMTECTALLVEDFTQSELQPADGVEDLLKTLRQRQLQLAVGSSSPPDLIALIIRKLGLSKYFDQLVSGYQVERGKPNPDLFLKIAELLSVSPHKCAVIEDSALGLEAAYKAGMKAVGVKNALSSQNMERAALTVTGFDANAREKILEILQEW